MQHSLFFLQKLTTSEASEAEKKPFKAVREHKEGGVLGGGATEASRGHRGVL